jgi:hypothetical protein
MTFEYKGTGKQVRYVTLHPEKELPLAPLKALVEIAALRAKKELIKKWRESLVGEIGAKDRGS